MKLVLLIVNVGSALTVSINSLQSFHRHCKLSVSYPEGKCLQIQNQNLTGCPQLNNQFTKDGSVLGYCDVVTHVDQNRNRVPEVIVQRKCKPDCTGPCAATGLYWCKQIWTLVKVVIDGNATEKLVESDCLCVKNVTEKEKTLALYGVI